MIFAVFMISVSSGSGVSQYTNVKNTMNQLHITSLYPKNKNGQTYGSSVYATSLETEPDLILATGVDGTEGYLLRKDMEGELPKTLEEAIAMQNSRSPEGRDIPLYDKDGETVIGVFRVGGE
ncbi:hypothetical protein KQ941_29750 [Paenibacillus xylanexedens]|uniref:hypothetical protein n=1 Tax=Paenibacillus xylanexedens TaxID=528191 RepID=UPI001F1A5C00|nr:hypothetical protein [Paenibacillus xylanexedens]MCF7758615.1 hypothetical protein [Paenibacillus xylanexedens]